MATFRSKSPFLMVPGKPFEVRTFVGGQTVVQMITPNYEFKNSVLITEDPKVIAELRASQAHKYGLFIEDGFIPPEAPPAAPDATNTLNTPNVPEVAIVEGVQSKNDAIAFLVQNKTVLPADLAGLKAGEVKALALSKYSIDFADWNV